MGTLPGGLGSAAYGINAAGTVVGKAYDSSGNHGAYSYANGAFTTMTNLPDVGTPAQGANDWGLGAAYAVNAAGFVGGSSVQNVYNPDGTIESNLTHAVVWNADGSIKADLRPLMAGFADPAGNGNQWVTAMNSTYAVGYYSHGGTNLTSFEYNLSTGVATELNNITGAANFTPTAINDSNVLVGWGNDPAQGNSIRAIEYNPTTGLSTGHLAVHGNGQLPQQPRD